MMAPNLPTQRQEKTEPFAWPSVWLVRPRRASADSDIDLRLACGATMTFGTLYELSLELEKELGRKVDIVTNPPEHMRPAFRKNLEKDEVRLYEAK